MVDEVDKQLQKKQQKELHKASLSEFEDLDEDEPSTKKEKLRTKAKHLADKEKKKLAEVKSKKTAQVQEKVKHLEEEKIKIKKRAAEEKQKFKDVKSQKTEQIKGKVKEIAEEETRKLTKIAEEEKKILQKFAEEEKKILQKFAEDEKRILQKFAEEEENRRLKKLAEQEKKILRKLAEEEKRILKELAEEEKKKLKEITSDKAAQVKEKMKEKTEEEIRKITNQKEIIMKKTEEEKRRITKRKENIINKFKEDPAKKLKQKLKEIGKEDATIKEKLVHVTVAVKETKGEVDIKERIYRYEAAIAGIGSGSFARICTQPLDVLKIRFQLQVEPISRVSGAKYHGLFHAVAQIIKEENVSALWKGHSTAQFLSTSYGMLQWGTYEVLTKSAWNHSATFRRENVQPFLHFICGGIAGCMGTIGSSPFDVIRTRLIGQGDPPRYKNLWHAAYVMFKEEGIITFYRGLVPALIQIAPYSGMQFMAYSVLTKQWSKQEEKGLLSTFLCGMASGLFAKSVIYPLDVAKKRLQVQGFQYARKGYARHKKYKGLIDCFRVMIRDEGPYSVYKGLLPSCMKAASNTGLNFMMFEHIIKFLRFLESDKFWA